MSKIECCGPVIGKVFGVGACCTTSLLANISFHSRVKSISAYNLMDMGRRDVTRLNQRIQALDRDSRASKAKCSFGEPSLKKKKKPLHFAIELTDHTTAEGYQVYSSDDFKKESQRYQYTRVSAVLPRPIQSSNIFFQHYVYLLLPAHQYTMIR